MEKFKSIEKIANLFAKIFRLLSLQTFFEKRLISIKKNELLFFSYNKYKFVDNLILHILMQNFVANTC